MAKRKLDFDSETTRQGWQAFCLTFGALPAVRAFISHLDNDTVEEFPWDNIVFNNWEMDDDEAVFVRPRPKERIEFITCSLCDEIVSKEDSYFAVVTEHYKAGPWTTTYMWDCNRYCVYNEDNCLFLRDVCEGCEDNVREYWIGELYKYTLFTRKEMHTCNAVLRDHMCGDISDIINSYLNVHIIK